MTTNGSLDVAVIGAGQAGLAIGHFLARRGGRFVILERDSDVAPAWRDRWDSLTLFTPRRYDSLPGLRFPGDRDGYPTRDEVVAYLRSYAAAFDLPVRLHSEVRSLSRQDGAFAIELDDTRILADQVVVATGPFQRPREVAFASALSPDVVQMHSTGYRNPRGVPEGTVLIVGGGNTGFQIAEELAADERDVHLSIGSRQPSLPQRLLGRDAFWWLTKTGVIYKTAESRIGRRAKAQETLVGSSPRKARRAGIELHPRATGARGRIVSFADGIELEVGAVVWATGFRADYSWIELPVTEDEHVRHERGVSGTPGLYFLGLQWQHTRGSALLGFVKDDAKFIADRIEDLAAQRAQTTPGGPMDDHPDRAATEPAHTFSQDPTGLPASVPPAVLELADGDVFELSIDAVAKQLGDDTVRMLGYNGSVPGPTLRVPQGAEVTINVVNRGDHEATVHWHGLRLDNRYDGTHQTQKPMEVGDTFAYRVQFPDPGAYWYHPHIREDYGQEMGLYGNIIVAPSEPDYWPPAHREVALTLDDVLVEDGKIASFSLAETTHTAMGRFGNLMLAGGETDLALAAKLGEVVRLYLTNTANTRVFNIGVSGARMKLVGGDSGRCEREALVESVILAPSERAVVDVLFDTAGEAVIEHHTPDKTYPMATIAVPDARVDDPAPGLAFGTLRINPDMAEERKRVAGQFDAEPGKTLAFVAEMDFEAPEGPVAYTCPMHPEVVSGEPGRCPECGMKLMPTSAPTGYVCPMHPEVMSDEPGRCPQCGMKLMPAALVGEASQHHGEHDHDHGEHDHDHDPHAHEAAGGIEWEDDMVEVNRMTTPANMRWKLIDRSSGAENAAIDWHFTVGDQIKIRLVNEMDSDHPMHHPFHIHGAGRFLVLARDGVVEPNLMWKDTVLVRTGEVVDILLDVTNPGIWMAHCHIAEHHESGMMFSFDVQPRADG